MANILKGEVLILQKNYPMEAEMAGGLSRKVANPNINGRVKKFEIFKYETEFTKGSPTPPNVRDRIQQFAIIRNYS
jgi:hypothetical protein